jgi:hypothetical protein
MRLLCAGCAGLKHDLRLHRRRHRQIEVSGRELLIALGIEGTFDSRQRRLRGYRRADRWSLALSLA